MTLLVITVCIAVLSAVCFVALMLRRPTTRSGKVPKHYIDLTAEMKKITPEMIAKHRALDTGEQARA